MKRALLVAFLVVVLSLGIVAAAGAATIQGGYSGSLSLQPAVSSAAAWVAGQSAGAGVTSAPGHNGTHCDHSAASAQDTSAGY